jgi:hypothetical protein
MQQEPEIYRVPVVAPDPETRWADDYATQSGFQSVTADDTLSEKNYQIFAIPEGKPPFPPFVVRSGLSLRQRENWGGSQ